MEIGCVTPAEGRSYKHGDITKGNGRVIELTDLSIADVSTEKLIRAAVRHGLYKCLSRDSAILDEKEEEMEFYGGTIKAPKVLADIVESIMGAVYLDCGFDVNDV
ncbi:hypothetical protein KY289_004935 [Solanum tuberosum]|nr:hypothetical protein KY289_004935 [Solanum tuberosum]